MNQEDDDLLGFTPDPAAIDEFKVPAGERPYKREDRFDIDKYTDPQQLVKWINSTRKVPLEAIDDFVVNETYPIAVWLFRAAAIEGHIESTRAMRMWLEWAQPIINRSKREQKKATPSKGSVAFLPREPKKDEE